MIYNYNAPDSPSIVSFSAPNAPALLPMSSANMGLALSRASASRIVFTASSLRHRRLVVASRGFSPSQFPPQPPPRRAVVGWLSLCVIYSPSHLPPRRAWSSCRRRLQWSAGTRSSNQLSTRRFIGREGFLFALVAFLTCAADHHLLPGVLTLSSENLNACIASSTDDLGHGIMCPTVRLMRLSSRPPLPDMFARI